MKKFKECLENVNTVRILTVIASVLYIVVSILVLSVLNETLGAFMLIAPVLVLAAWVGFNLLIGFLVSFW